MNAAAKPSVLSSVLTVLVIAIPIVIITQLLGWSIGTAGVGVVIGILYALIRYKKA